MQNEQTLPNDPSIRATNTDTRKRLPTHSTFMEATFRRVSTYVLHKYLFTTNYILARLRSEFGAVAVALHSLHPRHINPSLLQLTAKFTSCIAIFHLILMLFSSRFSLHHYLVVA